MAGGAERRKHPRVISGQRCWCEAGEVTLYAQMGNVSEGGIFIRTVSPLNLGTPAHLRFSCGREGELEAEAVVVWSREPQNGGTPGMGLKFVEIAPDARERIRQFISRETTPENDGP